MNDLFDLLADVRARGLDRRRFVAYLAGLASVPLLGSRAPGRVVTKPTFTANPFSLGVASGDPADDGFVLWTRLAPVPLQADGGMPPDLVEVRYEIAADEAFREIVAAGSEVAAPQLGHSVHVEAEGLQPDRWYWYRFRAGDAESPVGRTRTLPRPDARPAKLSFAFASCQRYEQGLFTAYQHMAEEQLDLVVHLGDYIYEYATEQGKVREVVGPEIVTLGDYRVRHAQYKTDEYLQAMHARCPWLVTWDDHEVKNNYADHVSEESRMSVADFLQRRANAYQAYYEAMPLRRRSIPRGPDMRLYRKASFGQLAELLVLDTRQYRTNQPNGDTEHDLNDAAFDPHATILGSRQRGWLEQSLLASPATWNVLAQQIMFAMLDLDPAASQKFYMDGWPGYAYERGKVLEFLRDRRVPNPVVLTGDFHANWAADLRVDDRRPEQPVVSSELIGTSIASGGDGAREPAHLAEALAQNPHLKFHNHERGYVRCTVTPAQWLADFRCVDYVSRPGAPIGTRASFVIEAGQPGLKPA